MKIGGFEKLTLIDFPGKVACMIYTIGCNFHCPYCHNPELVDETANEISFEGILEFLKTRQGLLEGVVITGGEPTLHKDLLLVMRRIKALGYEVKLDTNGTNPNMLQQAIDQKLVDYVAMDIKAPLYKYTTNTERPVDADALRKSIGILMKNRVPYEFRTTVSKFLLSPLDLVDIAKEIQGAEHYYIQKFIPTKILNPQLKRKLAYTDIEYEQLLASVKPYTHHCALR
jgi:pyruvate formate lyase activating enzyme